MVRVALPRDPSIAGPGVSVRPLPYQIAAIVERFAPGALNAFLQRAIGSHVGIGGVTTTSYYRSPNQNELARAQRVAAGYKLASTSPYSQHLIGTAADFAYSSAQAKARARAKMQQAGLIVIDEGNHLHAQLFVAGQAERAGIFRAIGL